MNDKLITRLVYGISVFVFIVVVILNRKIIPVTIETPSFVYFLPALNAMINGLCSLLLLVSLYQIKRKNIELHKKINITTFCLSSLFTTVITLLSPWLNSNFTPSNIFSLPVS